MNASQQWGKDRFIQVKQRLNSQESRCRESAREQLGRKQAHAGKGQRDGEHDSEPPPNPAGAETAGRASSSIRSVRRRVVCSGKIVHGRTAGRSHERLARHHGTERSDRDDRAETEPDRCNATHPAFEPPHSS